MAGVAEQERINQNNERNIKLMQQELKDIRDLAKIYEETSSERPFQRKTIIVHEIRKTASVPWVRQLIVSSGKEKPIRLEIDTHLMDQIVIRLTHHNQEIDYILQKDLDIWEYIIFTLYQWKSETFDIQIKDFSHKQNPRREFRWREIAIPKSIKIRDGELKIITTSEPKKPQSDKKKKPSIPDWNELEDTDNTLFCVSVVLINDDDAVLEVTRSIPLERAKTNDWTDIANVKITRDSEGVIIYKVKDVITEVKSETKTKCIIVELVMQMILDAGLFCTDAIVVTDLNQNADEKRVSEYRSLVKSVACKLKTALQNEVEKFNKQYLPKSADAPSEERKFCTRIRRTAYFRSDVHDKIILKFRAYTEVIQPDEGYTSGTDYQNVRVRLMVKDGNIDFSNVRVTFNYRKNSKAFNLTQDLGPKTFASIVAKKLLREFGTHQQLIGSVRFSYDNWLTGDLQSQFNSFMRRYNIDIEREVFTQVAEILERPLQTMQFVNNLCYLPKPGQFNVANQKFEPYKPSKPHIIEKLVEKPVESPPASLATLEPEPQIKPPIVASESSVSLPISRKMDLLITPTRFSPFVDPNLDSLKFGGMLSIKVFDGVLSCAEILLSLHLFNNLPDAITCQKTMAKSGILVEDNHFFITKENMELTTAHIMDKIYAHLQKLGYTNIKVINWKPSVTPKFLDQSIELIWDTVLRICALKLGLKFYPKQAEFVANIVGKSRTCRFTDPNDTEQKANVNVSTEVRYYDFLIPKRGIRATLHISYPNQKEGSQRFKSIELEIPNSPVYAGGPATLWCTVKCGNEGHRYNWETSPQAFTDSTQKFLWKSTFGQMVEDWAPLTPPLRQYLWTDEEEDYPEIKNECPEALKIWLQVRNAVHKDFASSLTGLKLPDEIANWIMCVESK